MKLKELSYYLNYPLIRPNKLDILITDKCNQNCVMCNRKKFDKELSLEEFKNYVNQTANWGIKHINISGGEPLLRKDDSIELIEQAKKRGIFTTLVTNGSLLNKKTCEELFNSGLDVITISLDGLEKTHDRIRGKGSFKKIIIALQNIQKLRRGNRFVSNIVTVVMKYNYKELVDVYELAVKYGVENIMYQCILDETKEQKYWLDEEDIKLLKQITNELITIKRLKGKIGNQEEFFKSLPDYFNRNLKNERCYAGYDEMIVNPDGSLSTCTGIILKNTLIRNIKKLWRAKEYNLIRKEMKKCKKPCMVLCWSDKK
ncbi:MAG: radical SAM protein [Nanoarchaeota archaeon]|nr:radical SAM protein [Nanoarchaeota archaeon]